MTLTQRVALIAGSKHTLLGATALAWLPSLHKYVWREDDFFLAGGIVNYYNMAGLWRIIGHLVAIYHPRPYSVIALCGHLMATWAFYLVLVELNKPTALFWS